MEFVILGLLLLKPMTGYEIGRFIKTNLSMICSNSAGSVQTAIKKLVAAGNIQFEEFVENGKNKKQFFITKNGQAMFTEWVHSPMQIEKVKNMELSKLFFLGFAENYARRQAITQYINKLSAVKNNLLAIKAGFEQMKLQAEPLQDVFLYQGYTLAYGIASAEFEIDWYTKLLHETENQK